MYVVLVLTDFGGAAGLYYVLLRHQQVEDNFCGARPLACSSRGSRFNMTERCLPP